MTPLIQAKLPRQDFAIAEQVMFTLTVVNPSDTELVLVADPRRGGDSLRFFLRLPSGQVLPFSVGLALQAPGVKQIPQDMAVPPQAQQDFDFDLAEWIRFEKPGNYSLKVEYEWKQGQPPWSSEVGFRINPPAGDFLEAIPLEAARTGYFGILWTEREGDQNRVLLAGYRAGSSLDVRSGREIARLPVGAAPALSMSPAGLPFSEHWLAWTSEGDLHALYYADTVENKLPPRTIPIGAGDLTLVRPVLAQQAPAEGRPGCLIGVITDAATDSATFLPVAIDRQGTAKVLPTTTLGGAVIGSWATTADPANPMFVFAIRSGRNIELRALTYAWTGTQNASKALFSAEAEFGAGDVRSTLEHQVEVGLMLKRDKLWERMSFALQNLGAKVEPAVSRIALDVGTNIGGARLNGDAGLHSLLRLRDNLSFLPAGVEADRKLDERIPRVGKFFDFLSRPNARPILVYYDSERGPITLGL